MTQATLSDVQPDSKRALDIAVPAHLGALIAAKVLIQAMIRDAVLAGFFPEKILEARLTEVIETATPVYFSASYKNEQATAKLYVQKPAQAAVGSEQLECRDWALQTQPSVSSNIQAPPPKMKTAMIWTSQRSRRADSARCMAAGHQD